MKHTPEPWRVSGKCLNTQNIIHIKADNKIICNIAAYEFFGCDVEETNANAARIVACVNACAGMDDPAAEIERLRNCESWLAGLLASGRLDDLTPQQLQTIADNTKQTTP